MNRIIRRSAGFTIIELSLVLIVLGILAAVLVPMGQAVHEGGMNDRDKGSLEVIRDSMLGYIQINRAIPCVIADPATGDPVHIVPFNDATYPGMACDPTLTLTRLGVRTTDARRQTFAFDAHETLSERWLDDNSGDICTQLGYLIDPSTIPGFPLLPAIPLPPVEPQVCDATNTNTGDTACVPTVPVDRPYDSTMAFVLVGRGSDRCLNLENAHASAVNDAVCHTAVADNRTFENPARRHSRTDDAGYYEDLVYTFSPTELAEALGCGGSGGGSGSGFTFCPDGEVLVQVSNGDNAPMSIGSGGSCYVISEGSTASMGCQLEGTTMSIHSNQACGPTIVSDTLANLDTNNDGRADIVCDNTSNCDYR